MQATPQEYQFHQRLCARGDPIAFAELAEWLYDALVQDVRKRAGYQADPVLVEEGRHLVATFHPELGRDSRVHELFLSKL